MGEGRPQPLEVDAVKFWAEPPDDRNQFYAYYALTGDFERDDVTARVHISPSDLHRIGEPIRVRKGHVWESGQWALYSKLERSRAIEDHLDSVFEQMRPAWQSFVELGSEYEAQIECYVEIYEAQGGGVYLSREVIQQASALNAYIDIDSYCLGSGDE